MRRRRKFCIFHAENGRFCWILHDFEWWTSVKDTDEKYWRGWLQIIGGGIYTPPSPPGFAPMTREPFERDLFFLIPKQYSYNVWLIFGSWDLGLGTWYLAVWRFSWLIAGYRQPLAPDQVISLSTLHPEYPVPGFRWRLVISDKESSPINEEILFVLRLNFSVIVFVSHFDISVPQTIKKL